MSPPLGPGAQKVQNGVENKINYFSTVLTHFRLSFGLFGTPEPQRPQGLIFDFFFDFGPEGPKGPL